MRLWTSAASPARAHRPTLPRWARHAIFSILCGAAACGGSTAGGPVAPAGPASPAPEGSRRGELSGAKVYDAQGHSLGCDEALPDCPPAVPDNVFLDSCRLAGYQVRQCGCAKLCAGDVSKAKRHWDASGNAKDCEPARTDCDSPAASAAFQDACSERGFKLAQCGCEWLCSGNASK